MEKTSAELWSRIKQGAQALGLILLSLVSFVVFLWMLTIIIRFIAGMIGWGA